MMPSQILPYQAAYAMHILSLGDVGGALFAHLYSLAPSVPRAVMDSGLT
jgi:hypothetical protein